MHLLKTSQQQRKLGQMKRVRDNLDIIQNIEFEKILNCLKISFGKKDKTSHKHTEKQTSKFLTVQKRNTELTQL